MKNLILIVGANGVGKSTACKALTDRLSGSAFIDSDYCRYMNPFSFTEEQIKVVISNISTIMINYFRCSTVENIVFQYGFHGARKQIFSAILDVLAQQNIRYNFCPVIMQCDLEENVRRMRMDSRDESRIQRAIETTRTIYDEYDYLKIDVTNLSVNETVDSIVDILKTVYHTL